MNKTAKYAINGSIICGLGNALLNFIKQINHINENPEEKFNWEELFIAAGKGALAGGIGGGILGAITDYQNSLEKPLNTDILLLGLVNNVKLSKNDNTYQILNNKADNIINNLNEVFQDKISGEPMKLGSTEKGTAIRDKFDIDICLPFKPGSFSSTEKMFNSVHSSLENQIGQNSIIKIREQKKSVGVFLKLHNDKFKIDIVPYKLTKKNSTSGYLYVNNKNIFQDNSSYTKTDIHALKSLKLTETQKRLVIVLKVWKNNQSVPITSYLLENLVLDAYKYNYKHIPRNFTNKLIMVFNHIKNNLESTVIRSIENTNNILTKISDSDKYLIIASCKEVIDEYLYHPNSIIKFVKG